MSKQDSTRELLINSAGELFAEHGFALVSTRKIADKAGVTLGSIHYHFGSKENLYIDTCLAAHSRGNKATFSDVIAENPNLIKTAEGQAEIIRTTIFRNFQYHFDPERNEWQTQILLREIAAPSHAMRALADIIFKPDTESAASFYKLVKPNATDIDAASWSDLLYGKLLLYSMGKKTIKIIRGEDCLTPQYYHIAAVKLARAMILEAGLPLPADLQE